METVELSEVNKDNERCPERLENSAVRKKYSQETLAEALDAFKNQNMTIYAAVKQYSIPSTTLFNRLKNENVNKMLKLRRKTE